MTGGSGEPSAAKGGWPQEAGPVIVGVGASAASPGSIERFFSRLTLEPDLAVVLVV